jgi:low affinity Fe/Cu permease
MRIDEPMPTRPDTIDRQRWIDEQRHHADESPPTIARRAGMRGASRPVAAHGSSWEQRHWTSRALHSAGGVAAHSSAGMLAAVSVVAWAIVGAGTGFPDWWQTALYSVSSSITFVMVFVIQHTQERQTSAMQRKLDELIRTSAPADDALIAIEGSDDEHLHALAGLNVADRELAIGQADRDPDPGC